MQWDVDNCPVPMELDEPAAVDGPTHWRCDYIPIRRAIAFMAGGSVSA